MRILVISDIHANLTALETVIKDAGRVDAVWCLGDLVGYGPDPNECIEMVRSLPQLVCLMGNHDAAALGLIDIGAFNHDAQLSALWTQRKLTKENYLFLNGLQKTVLKDNVTLTHGSPRNSLWEYIMDSYSANENFKHFNTPICMVGHSHLPLSFELNGSKNITLKMHKPNSKYVLSSGNKVILNPGSVGQPRDHDPRASFAIFDDINLEWTLRRVSYDIASVQNRINQNGLPTRHAMRLAFGW